MDKALAQNVSYLCCVAKVVVVHFQALRICLSWQQNAGIVGAL
jgi:hypothetical protein